MFDLVIENGAVVDGTGNSAAELDVATARGRIAAMGDLRDAEAHRRLDASGHVVSPGFIDLHTHCGVDAKHSRTGASMNYLQQGVTTVIGGNCGFGPVDFGAALAALQETAEGPNVGLMIGHNDVRLAVLGQADRSPTDDELHEMKRLVSAAMEAGAMGFTSGLYYVPGCYAETREVVELAKCAASHGGVYATHMRSESDHLEEALAEAIEVGRESGLPVQISHHKVSGVHNWGRSERALGMIELARGEGIDVAPDQYPYTASCARVGILLPRWVCADGDEQAHARLQDPEVRARIKGEVVALYQQQYGGELDRIAIASSVVEPSLAGKSFAEIAAERGAADPHADMAEFVMDLARDHPASCDTMCIFHAMCEDDVVRIMAHPDTAIASDGWGTDLGSGHPHPRLYGTFPRVLGRYCRERGLFTVEEAVRKMTSLPAGRLGITDRGVLKQGAWADVTIFDPATVADRSTFAAPHRYPVGIDYVVVNGELVLDHGEHTGALPGVFIPRA